jgi:hypothetical protein
MIQSTLGPDKRCPFCLRRIPGKSSTQEHIAPRWLRKHPTVIDGYERRQPGNRRQTLPGYLPIFGQGATIHYVVPGGRAVDHPLHMTTAVCRQCNNGWMSQLEDTARPLLYPMIDGGAAPQSDVAARTLARWSAKIAIALENEGPDGSSFSEEQVADSYQLRPSQAMRVYAATRSTIEEVLLANRIFFFNTDKTGATLSRPSAVFGSHVIAAGRIAFLTRHINPVRAGRHWTTFFQEPGQGWNRLWPPADWSPTRDLTDADIRETMNHDKSPTR